MLVGSTCTACGSANAGAGAGAGAGVGACGCDGKVTSFARSRDGAKFRDACALSLGEEMSPSRQHAFSGVLQFEAFAEGKKLPPVAAPGLVAAEDVPSKLVSVPTSTRFGSLRSWLS